MPYGYYGRILRVNLSSGAITVDEHDDNWYRRYLGGAAVCAYYLLRETPPGVEPLGPDNKLVIAPGVLTGLAVPGCARIGIGARSPLTGGIGKSEAGGFFGSELKHAGFDGIVIEGRAERPVYLWITNGAAELRGAGGMWGKGVLETEEAIRAETGQRFARIACIGPAGERLVRFASIIHDLKDAAGRGGMGAVMGSKRLKAIAVRGTEAPGCADPAGVRSLGKELAAAMRTRARGYQEYGTGAIMAALNLAGNIPTRNFLDGCFENIEPLSAVAIKDTIRVGMDGCYACSVRCKKVVKVDSPWEASPSYGGPEYETLAAFGCNCGVDDLKAVARAHHLCQHYGMDTISAGVVVAFVMECFQRGLLREADLDGLAPVWGSAEAMLALIEMVGERRGMGDLLAEGVRMAAAKIGGGAEDLAMHVRGLELGMHDPRLKAGMGLGYCVANLGGDHNTCTHDTFFEKPGPNLDREAKPLGVLEPMPAAELSTRKVHLFAQLHRWRTFQDSACFCHFVPCTYEETVQLVNACTGWNASLAELLLVGERAAALGRVFNAREGLTPADDRLPRRFFAPPRNGPLAERQQAIDPIAMEEAVRTYYYLMGWDPDTGVPTHRTLERLDVAWAAGETDRSGSPVR